MAQTLTVVKYPLDDDRYFKEESSKKQIFIHHTGGLQGPEGDINGWNKAQPNGKIATAFFIGRDGRIVQAFDDKYWAHHAQLGSAKHKFTIGIELTNTGPLIEKDGKFFNTVQQGDNFVAGTREIPSSDVVVYSPAYRGFTAYQKYTTVQLDSLRKLLCALTDKWGIPKTGVDLPQEFDTFSDAKNLVPGIYTHVNTRQAKFDCHPQPELLAILLNLSLCTGQFALPSFDDLVATSKPGTAGAPSSPAGGKVTKTNKSESVDGKQASGNQKNPNNDGEPPEEDPNLPDFRATFEQIERNVDNLELGDTTVDWGQRSDSSEDCDWIGLKQFLLYLASRYSPQSLFPFIELIPQLTVEKSNQADDEALVRKELGKSGQEYDPHGPIPKKTAEEFLKVKDEKELERRQKVIAKAKTLSEGIPGFNEERFNRGAEVLNQASEIADLFNLDPFQEGMESIDRLSESGKIIKAERNIGVRAYGQLVFSPAPIQGVASKPGAIGFKELEIKAGAQSDDGLALITMKLVDVQGNKFTDINSPWSFIYDVRPGSEGGDFFFRYGWQIRVPNPDDKDDLLSRKFWNHPGWKIFGDTVKLDLQKQILPGKQNITLTQSINVNRSIEPSTSSLERLALFDEGINFDESSGKLIVSRKALNDANYVKIAILNPEITMDENSAITATLTFRTTGSLARMIPLEYAILTKKLVAKTTKTNLGDLLIAVNVDQNRFSFLSSKNPNDKDKKQQGLNEALSLQKTRNFKNIAFVVGPESGRQGFDPSDIPIEIPRRLSKQLTNNKKESAATLLRWFREVLNENECELQSVATGSGAGINAEWIIVTTKKVGEGEGDIKKSKTKSDLKSANANLVDMIVSENDVFSYRFQGSLVETLSIEKTDAPNAMKIATDYAVGDLATFDSEGANLKAFNIPVTAADRKRNLITIFSQMQNCNVQSLCHPWIGPGRFVCVKGLGFFDGEYMVLQVTHKLSGHKFTSEIQGARMLLQKRNNEKDKEEKSLSIANGGGNFAQPVKTQSETKTIKDDVPVSKPSIPADPFDPALFSQTPSTVVQKPTQTVNTTQEVILQQFLNSL